MLKYILIVSIGILTSCGASKERKQAKEAESAKVEEVVKDQTDEISEQRPMTEEEMVLIVGTVRIKKDGCPVLIEMQEGDLYSVVYPVNLEDKFKVDGKVIEFEYLLSRAQMIEGCKAERVIAVSNVRAK
jgi:hypothetical protein